MKVLYLYTDPKDETTRYVGMGTETRPYDHVKKSSNPQLGNMINKRIKDGYEVQPKILCIGEDDYIKDLEIKLISAYGREDLNEGTLFNHTDGGDGVVNMSDDTKMKLSIIQTGRIVSEETRKRMSESRKGKVHSDETKKKIGNGNKDKIVSEETRKKLSDTMIGNIPWNKGKTGLQSHTEEWKKLASIRNSGENSPRYGISVSDETKKKMSIAQKGKNGIKNSNYKGKYLTPEGIFYSLEDAANANGIKKLTFYGWIKNSNAIINNLHISRSKILTENDLGKTFKELGFEFIPKEK